MYARALRIKTKRASFLKPRCLHHLWYLDLSDSRIESLPEDISILYHLQTLNLSYYQSLKRLPKGMKYMTTLHHLYTHGRYELKRMPAGLRHLTSLQTLTCFVAGAGSGCSKVGELGRLNDLGGQLELRELENVTEADAYAANLGNKKKLARLILRWTDGNKVAQNSDKEVLEGLKPHDGLKVLSIYSYNGNTSPTWLNKLQAIVELKLFDCKKLQKLPEVWQLPALKVLHLYKLPSFETWVETGCRSAFPALRVMALHDLEMFQQWEANEATVEEHVIFPRLETLSIRNCKSLAALPKASDIEPPFGGVETECRSAFPALRELVLLDLRTLDRWEAGKGTAEEELTFHWLEVLRIQRCPKLTILPEAPKLSVLKVSGISQQILSLQAASKYIASLSSLTLIVDNEEIGFVVDQNLSELVHGKEKWDRKSPPTRMQLYSYNLLFSHSSALVLWTCFAQLVDLNIWDCDGLVYWPEKEFQPLVSLRNLDVRICKNLTGRTREASEQSAPPEQSGLLPCLESLRIYWCASLVEVPNLPPSLKTLDIQDCNNLESIVFGQQEDTPSLIQGSSSEARASVLKLSLSSSANHSFLPCLESLMIQSCGGLAEVANLPPSIKTLDIFYCGNLRSLSGQLDALQTFTLFECSELKSLESCLGRVPSLEVLDLYYCSSLQSLPNGPQAYSSLRSLFIKSCPGIKLLPPSLQQRLDHLDEKRLDTRYEGWEYAIRRRLSCLK
ncbi:hypothetical protein PVAP13_3NG176799 [Panicum virgatum]|uniref:R13L1/DRL21-like LRR repeat region domain-containing protein n=1 Tax=Panicum virgatum TaxID=38727 RepID=A0A8T0U6X3_PANVG|nr:hypothetical protein PVAP13_3NG176799 [Panicum virgatum]